MKPYFTLARSLKTVIPTGHFRTVLLLTVGLLIIGEILSLARSSQLDFYYSLCALLLLIGLEISFYSYKAYTGYFFCASIILSTVYSPDTFNTFYLATFFGVSLAVLLANSSHLVVIGICSFPFFFAGFSEQAFLSWLLSSIAFYIVLFFLPLALRITWELKKTTVDEYATYREKANEANYALARELHDTVARHISVIGLTTRQGLSTDSVNDKDAALQTIEETTHRALADMRLLIRTIRGDSDPTQLPQISAATTDLHRALADARASLTAKGFTLCENITISTSDLPDSVRPTIYKVIQEIRFNAEKYAAPGSTISITAKPNLTGITIITSNQVKSHNKFKKRSSGTGYGLIGISERITKLGGTIHYGTTDKTWNLTVHLPLAI